MGRSFRIAYFAHSLRSDWNNGNAHFLRGLMRALAAAGHHVIIFEREQDWSIDNLLQEPSGTESLLRFQTVYSDLKIETYKNSADRDYWERRLQEFEVIVLHEWNTPVLAQTLLQIRSLLNYKLLFHDTHHRATSNPEQIRAFRLQEFDGVLAFGEALNILYRTRFGLERVWTLHEAADTTVFYPRVNTVKTEDLLWIGNWGEGERAQELCEFLFKPAAALAASASFRVYGVRYPEEGMLALASAGITYAGYLPNLDAPDRYATARITLHIPRQQYTVAMSGIPTIRVFEALASGIPLVSAPWNDLELLFNPGDYLIARNSGEMTTAIRSLLDNPDEAAKQACRGLNTILARHTCGHRADELTKILEELS